METRCSQASSSELQTRLSLLEPLPELILVEEPDLIPLPQHRPNTGHQVIDTLTARPL